MSYISETKTRPTKYVVDSETRLRPSKRVLETILETKIDPKSTATLWRESVFGGVKWQETYRNAHLPPNATLFSLIPDTW